MKKPQAFNLDEDFLSGECAGAIVEYGMSNEEAAKFTEIIYNMFYLYQPKEMESFKNKVDNVQWALMKGDTPIKTMHKSK